MSSHHAPQPETEGAVSTEHAPQVAVRVGNRLLCPCCGEVLMLLNDEPIEEEPFQPKDPPPAKLPRMPLPFGDVIAKRQDAITEAAWQAYEEAERAEQDRRYAEYLASDDPQLCADYLVQPINEEVAAYEFPDDDPPKLPARKRKRTTRSERSEIHSREDGFHDVVLEEPYSYQERRYMAWTYYQLKAQDLELQEQILARQAKIERLRFELGGTFDVPAYEPHLPSEDRPEIRPQVKVVEVDLLPWIEQVTQEQTFPPYESTRLVPPQGHAQKRGPPTFL